MIIAFIGKFELLHDEEYIARSFEMLGHDVIRINPSAPPELIHKRIIRQKPDILLFTKWNCPPLVADAIRQSRAWGMKTVCWLFDLYWGYEREFRIKNSPYFKSDYVFTTDGGNIDKWKTAGINHFCVRQGIYDKECYISDFPNPTGIAFVGSENPFYPKRTEFILQLKQDKGLLWYGRKNTNAIRGVDLNTLFAKTKIMVGDSVYSPHYWSNRIVETLGRGGFLIHRNVPGLKEEYPDLVTYDGTYEDLIKKIDYYLIHEDARRTIINKNYQHVKENYTMDKKCNELLSIIQSHEQVLSV